MKRMVLSALVTLSLVACAGSFNTFPVRGRDTELARIKGEWGGEYDSPATGRTGSIHFALDLAHSTGEGEVMMNVPGEAQPRPLQIASMHVTGDEVKGKLKRYTDPACNCQVDTEFVGVLAGETIDGTFTSHPAAGGPSAQGTWHVERIKM
jgi:hypothetical protein